VAQAFIPRLRRSHGRIVNMSSIGGRIGQPFLGPYSGSKFALEAISDAMRCELLPWGIHVALIEPGNVSTPIWEKGMGRVEQIRASATPEEVELYGRNIDRMEKLLKLADKRGVPPEKVARAVTHAMTASRPRTRYLVGADARVQLMLDRVLPTRVADRLFSKIAGS
jgi:NAD(P)-dependent dehydrogenase (short-subunit alcohol dehydrogenase family)